jgi:hypothetical protein
MKTKLAFSVLCFGWIVTLVRIWPSDRWPLIAVLAYIPSLLVLLIGLLCLIWIKFINQPNRRPIWLYLNWLLIIFTFLLVAADNRQFFRSPNSPVSGKNFRILHWNVWGSRNGYKPIATELRRHHPDLICLSEPILHPSEEDYPPYEYLLGDKWHTLGEGNMLILSKAPLKRIGSFRDDTIKGMFVETSTGASFKTLFLDVDPDLRHFRREVFHILSRLLAEKAWQPDVILGDLNTPALAFSLYETFLRDYNDTYFSAGSGIGYTWPTWFPMVRIDLIYVRHGRPVFRYEAFSSSLSDHRMHLIDIDLRPPQDIR